MNSTVSDLFKDISDGVLIFSSLISFLIGLSLGLFFDKFLTDQVEWVDFLLLEVFFGKLPTFVVLGFLLLRSSMLLQWSHLNTTKYRLVFRDQKLFVFIFVWTSFLAWILFNSFGLLGYWLGLDLANYGNSSGHLKGLIIDFDWKTSINGFKRLILESLMLSLLILLENSLYLFKINDPVKGFIRSFLILFFTLLVFEIFDIYLFF